METVHQHFTAPRLIASALGFLISVVFCCAAGCRSGEEFSARLRSPLNTTATPSIAESGTKDDNAEPGTVVTVSDSNTTAARANGRTETAKRSESFVTPPPSPAKPGEGSNAAWYTASWGQVAYSPFLFELPARRWEHAELNAALLLPAAQQPNWAEALSSPDQVRAVNAAIALAAQGRHLGVGKLAEAARDVRLTSAQRRAAIEALGRVPTQSARRLLGELTDELGRFDESSGGAYLADLHAEALLALQRLAPLDALPRATAALSAPTPAVRVAALRCWSHLPEQPLPARIRDMTQDPDATLRVYLLQLLAARGEPDAGEIAAAATHDSQLIVKTTALTVLGTIADQNAIRTLNRFRNDSGELVRAAALAALHSAGDTSVTKQALEDISPRVRKSLCESLAKHPDTDLAVRLLSDRSTEVRLGCMHALKAWPWEKAAGLLIDSLENEVSGVRLAAVEQLRARWPAAVDLSAAVSRERLSEQARELHQQLSRELQNTVQQSRENRTGGEVIVNDRPTLFCGDGDQCRRCLVQLRDRDPATRTAGWRALTKLIDGIPCEAALLDEFLALLEQEQDTSVWLTALTLFAAQHDPTVAAIMELAAGHSASVVRKQSLDWFTAHPHVRHYELLINSLADDHVAVVQAALRALAALPQLPDAAPLEALLAARDPAIRLAAAYALAAHGINPGYATLIRALYDEDPSIRRRAIQNLGELGDIRATEELLRMLDDRPEIQAAALTALRLLTGFNAAEDSRLAITAGIFTPEEATDGARRTMTLAEQAKCWRAWSQSRKLPQRPIIE